MLSLKTGRRNSRLRSSGGQVARRVRNVTVTVVILLLLFVGGGTAYTWYVGKHSKVEVPELASATEKLPDPFEKPPKMAPDAVMSASVQMITSPLVPGMNAMVNVKTNPDAKCKISVIYDKTPSTDSGLIEKVADEYGIVSWTWTVESTAPLGSWPVKVTCANEKNSAEVKADLKLQKEPVDATAAN